MEKFNKAVNESRYRRTRFLQQYNPKMRYTQYKIVPSNDLDPLRKNKLHDCVSTSCPIVPEGCDTCHTFDVLRLRPRS